MLRISAPDRLRAKLALKTAKSDGFVRESFALPRLEARSRARAWLKEYPAAVYMSSVDAWRELADGRIEFTMRRLPSAD
jgi:hypothetical protein